MRTARKVAIVFWQKIRLGLYTRPRRLWCRPVPPFERDGSGDPLRPRVVHHSASARQRAASISYRSRRLCPMEAVRAFVHAVAALANMSSRSNLRARSAQLSGPWSQALSVMRGRASMIMVEAPRASLPTNIMAHRDEHVKHYLTAKRHRPIENGHAMPMPRPTHHCHPQTSAVIVEGWHYPQTAGDLFPKCSLVLSPARFLLPSFFLFPHFFFFSVQKEEAKSTQGEAMLKLLNHPSSGHSIGVIQSRRTITPDVCGDIFTTGADGASPCRGLARSFTIPHHSTAECSHHLRLRMGRRPLEVI